MSSFMYTFSIDQLRVIRVSITLKQLSSFLYGVHIQIPNYFDIYNALLLILFTLLCYRTPLP
jgi:hypothetical protein